MRRVFVDPEAPQRDALQEAAKWIRTGGLVALPTDTLYGLAADPFRADAIARVLTVKRRPEGRALPLIAADADQIAAHLGPLSPVARRLVWSGGVGFRGRRFRHGPAGSAGRRGGRAGPAAARACGARGTDRRPSAPP